MRHVGGHSRVNSEVILGSILVNSRSILVKQVLNSVELSIKPSKTQSNGRLNLNILY